MMKLQHAADFIRTSKAPKILARLLHGMLDVFTFTRERTNRLQRFVLIVRAYGNGEPVRDIENKYGCSKQTVLRYARMAGLPKRPKHAPHEVRRATITLYKLGTPVAEISIRLGVSQAYVSKVATEEGINRRISGQKRPR